MSPVLVRESGKGLQETRELLQYLTLRDEPRPCPREREGIAGDT